MQIAIQFKIMILLCILVGLATGVYFAAQKTAVRQATPREKKVQTQATTGWADSFANHK